MLAQLREHLKRAGYDEERVDRLVRDDGGLGFEEGLTALRLRPEADEPLCVLVRLFLGRESVPASTVAAALAPVDLNALAGTGLIAVRDGVVRTRFALEPFAGLVVAHRIIVLERGRLVESGTHDELMARQGLYCYLASQQLEL